MKIIEVNINTIDTYGIYCIRDENSKGRQSKINWAKKEFSNGLSIFQVINDKGKPIAYLESIDAENAWRKVDVTNYSFIHCIASFSKTNRGKGIASQLLKALEEKARMQTKNGLCVIASPGVWMAGPDLFLKNGFLESERVGRFQLLYKAFNQDTSPPKFLKSGEIQKAEGFTLYYTHQCPWHWKSAMELEDFANENKIQFRSQLIKASNEANTIPGIYGTFALFYNGQLMEDHCISKTRFSTICKKLLNN